MSARYLRLLVGALLLFLPANADAGCALVWGTAEVSQSDAYADVSVEFMPGGSGPYSCNYYGEVGTPQYAAAAGAAGPNGPGNSMYMREQWWAWATASVTVAGPASGNAHAQSLAMEFLYELDQLVSSEGVGTWDDSEWIEGSAAPPPSGPPITLTASNYTPLQNSGLVTVTAQLSDPSYANAMTWEGCTPDSSYVVLCYVSTSTVGIRSVAVFIDNVEVDRIEINVQAEGSQQSGTLRLFRDVDGSFNPASPSDDFFSPGYAADGVTHVGLPQQVTLIAAYVSQSGQIVAPPQGVSSATITLQGTTNYEGHAMNAGTDTDYDYGFNGREQIGFANFGSVAANQARITLSVYDYGGSTKAWAAAGGQNSDLLGLPDSVPGTQDVDTSPNNNNHGDGITALEEWRGFMVQGQHVRLNPLSKDLFVVHEDANIWNFDLGFAQSLGVNYWIVALSEVDGDNWINFRSGNLPGHQGQKALRVAQGGGIGCPNEACTGQGFGITDPLVEGTPPSQLRPINVLRLRIFSNNIRFASPVIQSTEVVESPDQDKTSQTLAHEIGHAVSLDHFEVSSLPCPMNSELRSVMAYGFTKVSNGTPPNNCAWNNIPSTYRDEEERRTFKLKF